MRSIRLTDSYIFLETQQKETSPLQGINVQGLSFDE